MGVRMLVDFNHGSGCVYGRDTSAPESLVARINAHIDAALVADRDGQRPRDYLGASRIGEPCARRLVYELRQTPPDRGRAFDGRTLRIVAGLAVLSLFFVLEGNARYWALVGFVPLFTGLFRFCPAYSLIGFNTCPMKRG